MTANDLKNLSKIAIVADLVRWSGWTKAELLAMPRPKLEAMWLSWQGFPVYRVAK